MAPRPPVANVIKVEILWTQGSIPAANVLHCGYSSAPPSAEDLATLAAAVQTTLKDQLQASYGGQTVQTEVICTDLSTDSGYVGSASTPWTGSDTESQFISAGSAFLTNWEISRRYRGGKPRTYWPAVTSEAMETQSTWGSTIIGVFNTAMAALQATFVATYGSLVCSGIGCVSYRSDNSARVDPVYEPFTGFSHATLVRSQRRRITASSF